MNIIYISKQRVVNERNELFAYELLFKDADNQTALFSDSVKETSQLIINSITSTQLNQLLGKRVRAFIQVNEKSLMKGILDLLDEDRFILNLVEDIQLNEDVISKIIQYRKRGFQLCINNFDSSAKMIEKFSRLFNYIDYIKMDIVLSNHNNLKKVVARFQDGHIKFLAFNIENRTDLLRYTELGFDLFQGYYIDKPELIEIIGSKEPTQFILLQLIKIIKDNDSTEKLEFFIKKQPDLSYKLIQFFNRSKKFDVKIKSLTQVITLMGRIKLLKWLMVYLYSELSKNPASETILSLAIRRAERMESEAAPELKDKAYLAGMFSMLSSIFETDIHQLMYHIEMDRDITQLVLEKKGIFASSLMRAEHEEKAYLKKIMMANFDKLDTTDLIYTLEDGGIEIDKDKI